MPPSIYFPHIYSRYVLTISARISSTWIYRLYNLYRSFSALSSPLLNELSYTFMLAVSDLDLALSCYNSSLACISQYTPFLMPFFAIQMPSHIVPT